MKNNTFIIALVTAMTLGFSQMTYADNHKESVTSQDIKKETQELISTLGKYTASQRDEAKKTAEKAMKKLDNRIESLEYRIDTNWDNMTKATQKEAKANLKALRQQRNELAEWYGGFKHSSSEAWSDVKQGFSGAYKAINNSLENALNEYEENDK